MYHVPYTDHTYHTFNNYYYYYYYYCCCCCCYKLLLFNLSMFVQILRELTVKSMLALAPKLNKKNLNDKLMRYFSRMQGDQSPVVRTNTIICIGRLAELIEEKTREAVLLQAFVRLVVFVLTFFPEVITHATCNMQHATCARSLKDGFPHARASALRAFAATKVTCRESVVIF